MCIRDRAISAAIRLNPQSALWKIQHRFGRSNLELRRPRNASELARQAHEGRVLRRCSQRSQICRRNSSDF
eukprot:7975523-Alexandrium_andersonii.AAC.1